MSTEEDKIRRVKEWATNFPGAQQHTTALLKLRSGPLKGFVEEHLVGRMRWDDWIRTMTSHFHLQQLRKETEREQTLLEMDLDELSLLENTCVQLREEEDRLERGIGEELNSGNPSLDSHWKVHFLRKEGQVTSTYSIIQESQTLREGLGKLDTFIPTPFPNKQPATTTRLNNRGNAELRLTERLNEVKEELTRNFILSARGSNSQRNPLQLPSTLSPSLQPLGGSNEELGSRQSGSEEELDFGVVGTWSGIDLEGDKVNFLRQMNEMKGNDKVSLSSELVDEWTGDHVSLSAGNEEVTRTLATTTQQLHSLRLSSSSSQQELTLVLDLLAREKKKELTCRHFAKMNLRSIGIEGMSPVLDPDADERQYGLGLEEMELSPFTGTRRFPSDELPFALTCILFKTWPNLLTLYGMGVEEEDEGVESLDKEGHQLRMEIQGNN